MSIHSSNNRKTQSVSKTICGMYLLLIVGCFKPRDMVPNLNHLNINQQRTESLEDIWRELDQRARHAVGGAMFGPFAVPLPLNHPAGQVDTGPGANWNQYNFQCMLRRQQFPGMTIMGQEHVVYFRKERFAPQRLRQEDQQDNNADIYAIFASKTNTWIRNFNVPGNNYLDQFVNRFGQPGDQLGVVLCRRQKIEWVQVDDLALGCDIGTWLMYLCFVDLDAQHPLLRRENPDDYRQYIGGRPESKHFKNMVENDCRNVIAAIPKNSKLAETPRRDVTRMGSERVREWTNMLFILAAYMANYEFLLVKHRHAILRSERLIDQDCPTMSTIEVRQVLFEEAVRRGPRLRNRYEPYWIFCAHETGHPSPNVNVVPRRINKTITVQRMIREIVESDELFN